MIWGQQEAGAATAGSGSPRAVLQGAEEWVKGGHCAAVSALSTQLCSGHDLAQVCQDEVDPDLLQ